MTADDFMKLVDETDSVIISKELFNELLNNHPKKSAEWITHEKYLECPYCNIWYLSEHLIRNSYCPNCGARLVETQERSKE